MLFGNKNNANDHIAIYLLVRRKTESSQAVSQGNYSIETECSKYHMACLGLRRFTRFYNIILF